MTLEPVKPTAEIGENRELADMSRRFWIALVLTLPVFGLEMGGHISALGLDRLVPDLWPMAIIATVTLGAAAWMFRNRLE